MNSPFKSTKYTRRLGGVAGASAAENEIANEHRERNEAGEPEQHGQSLHGEDGKLMRRSGEQPWREGEVC